MCDYLNFYIILLFGKILIRYLLEYLTMLIYCLYNCRNYGNKIIYILYYNLQYYKQFNQYMYNKKYEIY